MKTTIKTAVASIATIVALTLGAAAADLQLVLVANPHGQSTALYRATVQPTIALNIGKRVLGNHNASTTGSRDLAVTKIANGHGQDVIQYRKAE